MRFVVLLLVLLHAVPAMAGDKSFRLVMTQCTTVVGHLDEPSKGLEIKESEPKAFACTGNDFRVLCSLESDQPDDGDGKARQMELAVMADSERRLLLLQENGADYISIRPDIGSASMTTRIVNAYFAGSTVCVGSYQPR